MRRINITLDDIVDDRAINFCKKHNIKKSALISTALTEYISAQELLPSVQTQLDELKAQLELLAIK